MIFYSRSNIWKYCNYADDNHIYNKNLCVKNVRYDLVSDGNTLVTWFHKNHMVANPENI